MRKINYIASAGTGKTYQLVEEVYNNYILKGISIENLFISTFTEKSAGELKNRIINKLKSELYKGNNVNQLFDNIYKIQESYIGTIHSLCLKIIKTYPEETFITKETKILESFLLDLYFDKSFEEYIKNNQNINETVEFIQDKNNLYKIFKDIYYKRSRIIDIDIKELENKITNQKNDILNIKNSLIALLDDFINKYYKELIFLKENIFKTDLIKVKKLLEYNRFINIELEHNKTFPRFLKSRNISSEASLIKKSLDKNILNEENKLIEDLENLKSKALYLNYLIVLKEFHNFNIILENLKKENDCIDYDDIIIKCINLLKNHSEINQKFQNKFKALFIDEFQDTDNLQLELVKLLSEKSDLIVLGDPKQCIYEWRNANLDDYINFIDNDYFETINLDTCYRSNKSLVGFYNYLFTAPKYNFLDHLKEIYISEIKANKNEDKDKSINLISSQNEALDILEKIKELIQEGYKYEDIMILFRKNKQANELVHLLKNNSIPFISYLDSDLKNNLEISSVLNLIKLIKYPFDKLNLLAVLKSPIFCFSDLDIYNIKDKLDIYEIEEFKNIKELIDNLDTYSIFDILKFIYKEYKIIEIFSLYPDSVQKIENLNKLLKMASNFDRNNFQFRDFIEFLDKNKEETENIILDDKNFIKIMTIHKSKGLEAKVVIIPYLLDKYRDDDSGFHNIDNLMVKIKNNNRLIAKSSNFDENKVKYKIKCSEKRLLYVAFTRSKEKLILLANEKEYDNRRSHDSLSKEIFSLIQNIKNTYEENFEEKTLKSIENINYWDNIKNEQKDLSEKIILLENIEKKRIEDYEKSIMNKNISSVSQLMKTEKIEDYENNNVNEYDNYIKTYSAELGTLVHKVLESFSFKKDKNLAKEEILSIINSQKNLVNYNVLNDAKEIILNFLDSKNYNEISDSNILFKELPFTLKENDKYIEGIIDLVYEKNNKIIIMDYKTNRIKDKEELEKNYKIQKDYYKKAIKLIFSEKNDNDIEFKFCWLREKN